MHRADGAIRFKKKTFGIIISNSHILLGEYVLSSPSSETCLYLLQTKAASSTCVESTRKALFTCMTCGFTSRLKSSRLFDPPYP